MAIKFVVFDFDGNFSDGAFYFDESIVVSKCHKSKDASSLILLKERGIKCGIISNDKSVSIDSAPHIFDRFDKCSIGQDRDKLKIDVLAKWLQELKLSYHEVAYIGYELDLDLDLTVIDILKKVGFAACTEDAIMAIKNMCNYICSPKGGDGAVRDCVDKILEMNDEEMDKSEQNIQMPTNDGKITAVIPVRKGSTRCKNKNIRDFGDTNLLKLKIETLKKVSGIDKILVSSNCDEMLKIAKDIGVDTHKRDEKFCTNDDPGSFFCNLATTIDTEIMMHIPVTTPLITYEQYDEIIDTWNKIKNKHDTLNCTSSIKEFIWHNGKSVNYDSRNPPPSQNLPNYSYLNFACNIIHTKNVIKYNNIIGNNPYLFDLDAITGIDIDENSDFIIAELLHENNIIDELTCKNILEKRNNKLELLDCTIRDGGYLNNWEFSDQEVLDCYRAVTGAKYSYFEIGFRTNKEALTGKGKWCYSYEADINAIVKEFKGCKIAVMAKVGTVTIADFIEKKDSNISLVRVLLPRTTNENGIMVSKYDRDCVNEAKGLCLELINYGYDVCINFGCGDIIDDDEIKIIVSHFHDVPLKSLYLADTYGGFNVSNVAIQLHKFYTELHKYNSTIPFGFHSHNNNEDALSKSSKAIYHGCTMIDTCIGGLGRGAGNLKSEQFLTHHYGKSSEYIEKITPIVLYYDKYILSKKQYNNNPYVQGHPYYMISSVLSLHPDYVAEILANIDTPIVQDIDLMMKLDEYTKKHNVRNFDKTLITTLIKTLYSNDSQ